MQCSEGKSSIADCIKTKHRRDGATDDVTTGLGYSGLKPSERSEHSEEGG